MASTSWTLLEIASLEGHEDRAWTVAWNPKQPLLASCSSDKSVRLYHYSSRNADASTIPRFTFATSIPTGHKKTVRSIAWSPSGQSLATASFDSTIAIFERAHDDDDDGFREEGADIGRSSGEWECVSTLEGHESECKCVAYSYNGALLASCSRDKSVWIWEVQPDSDFECLGVLMEHTQDVKALAWHPKEDIVASASYDDTINLYMDDPDDDWFPYITLKGHESTVWSVVFSPCGGYLASASDDLSIKIWMRERVPKSHGAPGGTEERWSCQQTIANAHERTIYSLSWTSALAAIEDKGNEIGWIASVGGDGKLNVWRIQGKTTETDPPIRHHLLASISHAHGDSDINSVAWCPREASRDVLATAGDDGLTKIWRIERTASMEIV